MNTDAPPARPVPQAVTERMIALRRDLHRHPELSWQEARTMGAISAALTELGISHRTGVAGTGIIADLPGETDGPLIALRADTDALPVQEATGLTFASQNPGVMHACGHDGHSSMLLGAAALLAAGPRPPLPVRLIWQPAEESGLGASAMIEAGALDGVAAIFGGHIDMTFPPGVLGITEGGVNASSDMFRIVIKGKGGHGARPHQCVDAVVAGAAVVTALQTVVAREIDPSNPAVITVGSFHAGSTDNVIAHAAELIGTLRSHHPEVRARLFSAIQRIAEGVAAAHGAEAETEIKAGCPAVINTPEMVALAREAGRRVVGEARLDVLRGANMGGEDFGSYLERIPGCYIRFGAIPGHQAACSAHSSGFDFDEAALPAAAAWFAEVAHVAGAWGLAQRR